MEIKKETTKQKFERIWGGIDYHMDELARFFLEYENDPFLETEYGKKMEEYSKVMTTTYLMGKMMSARNKVSDFIGMMMGMNDEEANEKIEETKKPEEKGKEAFSMEDMLKSVFGMDDKKEDKEP